MNRRQFVLGCVCTPPLLRAHIAALAQNVERSWLGKASAGQPMNLARYGELKSWLNPEMVSGLQNQAGPLRLLPGAGNGQQMDVGFEWPEFRTVREVTIRFAANPPDAAKVFLEYWEGITSRQGGWRVFEYGTTNGTHLDMQGPEWTYRFSERRTCKVRLRFAELPQAEIAEFAIYGPSIWKPGEIRIEWGHMEKGPWNGKIETYNGEVLALNPIGAVNVDRSSGWKSKPGERSGLAVSFLYAWGMDVDRSILTIRSESDCSFLPGEAVEDEPIDMIDYGIYVRDSKSAIDYAAYRAQNQGRSRIIDAVAREPEQTMENAYVHIKARRVSLSFVGAEANNQKFGIAPDGHFVVGNSDPLSGDPIKPSFAVYFDSVEQPFLFQVPPPPAAFQNKNQSTHWVVPKEQHLEEGWLPIVTTRWSENNLAFKRTDFGALLHASQGEEKLIGNEPAVLISTLRIRNSSPTREIATYYVRPWKPAESNNISSQLPYGPLPANTPEAWTTGLRDNLVIASTGKSEVLVCSIDTHKKGSLALAPSHNAVRYQVYLDPGEEHVVHIVLPGWEPPIGDAATISGLDYDQAQTAMAQHWKRRAAQSMRIQIPDAHLQNLFDASMQHFLLALTKNGHTNQYFPNVAMFYYGSIGSESSPIIRALDMRGLHQLAERCLEAFLATQGEFMPEGDYRSKEGGFYRFWPNYTSDQGGVLWALADHYHFTRDDEWLRRVAPKIIAGCEFLVRARKQTMIVGRDGAKPLSYGLAPAGCVSDPRDWEYTFMLNAWFYAGLKNCAEILEVIDPAKAKSLAADAADYQQCILRALRESVALSPATRLRDNTSVPSVPSYLGLRGFSTDVKDSVDPDRRHGYGYDCTMSPLQLFTCGLLEANDPTVTTILNYLEDRFFLFTPLESRVNLDHLATDWFNLGGFGKLQPYYVHYQDAYLHRDQIPNFLRGFYNTIASIADPQTLTFQEELDFSGGQPHKTHEEAWFFHQLRKMLVVELGTELHLARGTPRSWLKGEQEISVQHAPTYFGQVSYSIRSSPDSGSVTAEVDLPTEHPASRIVLRLRHPDKKPIRAVKVNGKPWAKFSAGEEWIELPAGISKVAVTAHY